MILKLVRFNPAAQACLVLLALCIGALPPAAGFGAASHQDADATFGVICVDANGETVEAAEVYVFQNRGGDDRRYIQFGPLRPTWAVAWSFPRRCSWITTGISIGGFIRGSPTVWSA